MLKLKNKLITAFLIGVLAVSFGQQSLFAEDGENDEILVEEEPEEDIRTDVPRRTEDEMLDLAELYAENEFFELWVVDTYDYITTDAHEVNIPVDENNNFAFNEEGELNFAPNKRDGKFILDGSGKPVSYEVNIEVERGEFVPVSIPFDESGALVYEANQSGRLIYEDGEVQFYQVIIRLQREKTKQDIMFGVRNKANGFIWWSSPINATHDSVAKGAQVDNLSSMFTWVSGNPVSYTTANVRSNTREKGFLNDDIYVSACEKIEKIENGVRFHFNFKRRNITVLKSVMEVTLDGNSLYVLVPVDKINETDILTESGSLMLSMSVLNSFGAAPEGEDGYIVVPDGSGAVIEFDNQKTNAALYNGQVYGRDLAVSQKLAPPVIEQVFFPMFGIVRKNAELGDNVLVAIAEKGDENAFIRANVSRQNATTYNAAWFEFRTRTTDSYYIGTRNSELTIFEQGGIKTGDIAVRYYLLSGENLSYVDVGNTYREYLIEYKGLQNKSKPNSSPYYLTLNGGTVKTHSILGFPVDLQSTATTYAEALEIAQMLKEIGAEDLIITYIDFNTAGIKREITPTVQYSSRLGGKSDYKKFNDFIVENGYSLYPSVNMMEYFKSGNGYSYLLNSSKQVTRAYASQEKYEYAFGTVDKLQDSWTILSPHYFNDVFERLIKSFNAEGITSISLDRATSLLYSDFSRRNPYGGMYYNRRDTVQILTEGYQKLNDAGITILAQSANAYALPYVDEIIQVPLFSSNYDIFDYDIPLYQIVIHGLIPHSTKAFNASADSDTLRLLALSTGTPLHYDFMHTNPSEFTASEYNRKFYANYTGWVEKSVKEYELFKFVIADVSDKRIIDHKRISVYETETTFEGGKTIYVNIDTGELRVNGQTIDFGEYGLNRRASYAG
ncbi:MAG: DUF5696 domain-containing protein [Oscillospiraceae bacterium]|nr:DUF5696 domain-containing protein [Oscillospiraceae bacterium]